MAAVGKVSVIGATRAVPKGVSIEEYTIYTEVIRFDDFCAIRRNPNSAMRPFELART